MGVINGEVADQANFNSAFMDREGDTDTIGKVDLLNSDSPEVYDIQSKIGLGLLNIQTETTDTSVSIGAERNRHVIYLSTITGEVTLNDKALGELNLTDGSIFYLVGTSDTNVPTLVYSDIDYGLILNGNIRLTKHVTLTLIYRSSDLRFIELERNS